MKFSTCFDGSHFVLYFEDAASKWRWRLARSSQPMTFVISNGKIAQQVAYYQVLRFKNQTQAALYARSVLGAQAKQVPQSAMKGWFGNAQAVEPWDGTDERVRIAASFEVPPALFDGDVTIPSDAPPAPPTWAVNQTGGESCI